MDAAGEQLNARIDNPPITALFLKSQVTANACVTWGGSGPPGRGWKYASLIQLPSGNWLSSGTRALYLRAAASRHRPIRMKQFNRIGRDIIRYG